LLQLYDKTFHFTSAFLPIFSYYLTGAALFWPRERVFLHAVLVYDVLKGPNEWKARKTQNNIFPFRNSDKYIINCYGVVYV